MKNNILIIFLIVFLIILTGIIIKQSLTIKYLRQELELQSITNSNLVAKLKESDRTIKDLSIPRDVHPIEQKVQDCMKQNNFTTAGMSQCVNDSVKDWSNEIDKSLTLFKNKLSKEQYVQLQVSQAQWEKYKLAELKFLSSVIGSKTGTIYINILSGEKAAIVETRARDLAEVYDMVFP